MTFNLPGGDMYSSVQIYLHISAGRVFQFHFQLGLTSFDILFFILATSRLLATKFFSLVVQVLLINKC